MSEHKDDDPMFFRYSSSKNATFRGKDESGYTWAEWREMSEKEKGEVIQEYANGLVDAYVEDDE